LTPRILGERGVMLGAEYRYLTRFGGGEVGLQVLPGDSEFDDETRSLFTYRHLTLTDDTRGRVEVDYNDVSDPQYFEDFGRSLSTSSTRFLRQSALASYRGNWWTLYSRIESYEDVDTTLSANQLPYKRLPQLRLQVRRPLGSTRFDYGFSSDATYFDRDEGITGGRIDVRPFIRYNWRTAAAFVIPKLTVAHTRYLLDETPATADDTPDRTIPTLSVDSGIFLDRDFDFRGSRYLQTLEPRAFYLLTPRSGQDDLPVFDSGLYDFTFQNLYRENRFTGLDRVADANQLSLALTSRLLERETGAEFFRASFGQIYYFRDRNVALPGDLPDTRDTSEFIAEVAATTRFGLSARTTLQWDPDDEQTEKAAIALRYQPTETAVINASYRFRRAITDIEQTDVSWRWPVTDRWSVVGRWNYSLQNERTLEAVGGIEYSSCCWGMRLVGRRFLRNTEGKFDAGVFLQLSLRGLGNLGQKADTFLQRSIPGYVSDF
ncbi:MAG: LPS assembly protein LptD, partial [Gammaproteobacteria bacterium]|nr:LPS assembly protein LptD [Gammaproteobacteria bacterium]